MTDLRTGLVEAGAQALDAFHHGPGHWTARSTPMQETFRREAEAALDAMLDVLTDHADRFGYEHMEPPGIRDLIGVLSTSGDTGEKP